MPDSGTGDHGGNLVKQDPPRNPEEFQKGCLSGLGIKGYFLTAAAVLLIVVSLFLLRGNDDTPEWIGQPQPTPTTHPASPTQESTPARPIPQPLPTPTPLVDKELAAVVASVRPSVVKVSTRSGSGSGVIAQVDSAGNALIVTNHHVIEDGGEVTVIVGDTNRFPAVVLSSDRRKDLAVLKICCARFQAAALGDLGELPAGTTVFAMGYPLGISEASVTRGIVSRVYFDDAARRWLIQTDTPINPGNSGGPLFTTDGRVIGINTSAVRESKGEVVEGFGFAIGADTVREAIPQPVPTSVLRSTPTPRETPTATPVSTSTPVPTPGPTPTPVVVQDLAASEFALGDFVRVGNVVVGVLGWREWQGGITARKGSANFAVPGPGRTLVLVDLMLVNTSAAPLLIAGNGGSFALELKDSEDRTYRPEGFYGVRRSEGLEHYPVAPGERISGEVAFSIPLDAEGLVLTFAGDQEKAFFALGPGPETVDPPERIPGQAEIAVHLAGDTLDLGVVVLTVHGVSFSDRNADAGFRFAVVDYSVRNVSAEAINLDVGYYYGTVSISVKDLYGFVYGISPRFANELASPPIPEGNFAPGERKRGSIIFEVPRDARDLVVVFQPSFFLGVDSESGETVLVSDSFWPAKILIGIPDADNEA